MSLNSETKKFCCIVDLDGKGNIEQLESCLSANMVQYAFIKHFDEVSLDTGIVERPHLHIYCICEKKHRLSYFLSRISEWICIDAMHIHHMEIWKSYESGLRYLCHKDEPPQKKRYDLADIHSNIPIKDLEYIMNLEKVSNTIDMQYLFDLCESHHYKRSEIMKNMTLGQYMMYRNVINDIIKSYTFNE